MKTAIAVVACAVVGFVGLQAYFWTARSKEPAPEPKAVAEAPKPDEEKPKPAEEPPPPPRPKKSSPTTASKSTTAAPKQFTSTPAQTKPRPKATKAPPTELYFTTEGPYQKGIPSSVTRRMRYCKGGPCL